MVENEKRGKHLMPTLASLRKEKACVQQRTQVKNNFFLH